MQRDNSYPLLIIIIGARHIRVLEKMVYSHYKKMRILYLTQEGHKPPTIAKILEEEGMKCSRRGIAKFLKKYRKQEQLPGALEVEDQQK